MNVFTSAAAVAQKDHEQADGRAEACLVIRLMDETPSTGAALLWDRVTSTLALVPTKITLLLPQPLLLLLLDRLGLLLLLLLLWPDRHWTLDSRKVNYTRRRRRRRRIRG